MINAAAHSCEKSRHGSNGSTGRRKVQMRKKEDEK